MSDYPQVVWEDFGWRLVRGRADDPWPWLELMSSDAMGQSNWIHVDVPRAFLGVIEPILAEAMKRGAK